MFIQRGNTPKYIGRKVRNVNGLSNRYGWVGEIVDQDETHILVQYKYTLQTYMKGRRQQLQLLSKSHG